MIALTSVQAFADTSVKDVRYRVTLKNVTAANGISPFIAVIHKHQTNVFTVGTKASNGLAEIAETGSTATLETELSGSPITLQVTKAQGMPLGPTETRSIEFTVPAKFVDYGARLTILGMIGKSNDSFVAFKSLELRAFPKGLTTLRADNYDAGSEENTGNVADFGPGGHPVEGAEGFISFDRGLNSRGDAPEIIGWGTVAAQASIERLN